MGNGCWNDTGFSPVTRTTTDLHFESGGTFDQLVGASIHYRIAF